MNIKDLTKEEKARLLEELASEEKREREERAAREADYKRLSGETVDELWPTLKEASLRLAEAKTQVVGELYTLVGIKQDLYGVKDEQRSHSFINRAGTRRITIGVYTRDAWDETVGSGEAKIREAIRTLGRDDNSRALVDAVLTLLSKDKAGNLKIKSVWQLQKLAERIENDDFREGLRIIQEAYRPEPTKIYVVAEEKNDLGAWVSVPLGMTEAK